MDKGLITETILGQVVSKANNYQVGNNRHGVQIPFDMRSVIPAICGHSFFKYFYGCKVNVLNRYLGRQTVFFC